MKKPTGITPISTALYHRFYRLPGGVRTHPRDGRRIFETIPDRRASFGNVESVEVGDGIKIHYLYDPPYKETSHNKSISGSITISVSTCAIVFRGEMFDVRKSRKWAADSLTPN
jgi:hypothetical protein